MPCSGCFDPRKEIWYKLYRILDGPEGRPGQVQKVSPPSRFDPWDVQTLASLYTNYAVPSLLMMMVYLCFFPFRWHDILKSSLHVSKVTFMVFEPNIRTRDV
jgi:hypothetical protein